MNRVRIHRVIPAALMAAATAIPIATTVEILAHVSTEQAITPATTAVSPPAPATATPATSTATAAAVPATSTATAASATSTPTAPSGTSNSAAAPAAPTASATSAPSTATQPAATATQPAATATPATARTYVGPVEYDRFGAVQATITVAGGKITNVAISAPEDNPRSADINTQAIPILQSETLQAQSASIDIVSGATYTSEAYEQSLQAALAQSHLS